MGVANTSSQCLPLARASHFRPSVPCVLAIFFCINIGAFLAPAANAAEQEPTAEQQSSLRTQQVQEQIRALSSSRYTERRAAFLRLWKDGSLHIAAIERAAQTADQQLEQTLRLLEALIKLKVEPGDAGATKSVAQFLARPTAEIIGELCARGQWELASKILRGDDSLRQRLTGRSGSSDLRRLLRIAFSAKDIQEAWPVVELLLPSAEVYALARLSGVQLSQEFQDDAPESHRAFFSGDFQRLVDSPEPWREKLPWVVRAGYWQALAEPGLHAEIAPTIASPQVAKLVRCVLLNFAGDYSSSQAAWESLLESTSAKVDDSEGAGQGGSRSPASEMLGRAGSARPIAQLALLCLGETGAIAEYLESAVDEAGSELEAIAVLASLGEYGRAFEVAGLEPDLANFDSWLEETLKKLAKELRPGEDTQFQISLRMCSLLSQVGENAKAKKLLETIAGVISIKTQSYGRSQRNAVENYLWQSLCRRLAFADRSRQMLLEIVRRDFVRMKPAVRQTAVEYLFPAISNCALVLLETSELSVRPKDPPTEQAWTQLEQLYRLDRSLDVDVEAWLRRSFAVEGGQGDEAAAQLSLLAKGYGMADLAVELAGRSVVGQPQAEAAEIFATRGRLDEAIAGYSRLRSSGRFDYVGDEIDLLLRAGRFDDAQSLRRRRMLLPLLVKDLSGGSFDPSAYFTQVARKLFDRDKFQDCAEYGQVAFLLSAPYRLQAFFAADLLARSLEELKQFDRSSDARRACLVELLYGSSDINQIFSSPTMTSIYFASLKSTVVQERLERAVALIKRSELDAAIREIDVALKADPRHIEIAVQTVPLLASQRPEVADRVFDTIDQAMLSVLQEWPDNAFALNNLAWMYAKCGRKFEEAEGLAEKATRLAPGSATYLDTLAEVQFLRGDADAAMESARQCVHLDPRESHYRSNVVRFRAARSQSK